MYICLLGECSEIIQFLAPCLKFSLHSLKRFSFNSFQTLLMCLLGECSGMTQFFSALWPNIWPNGGLKMSQI